MSLAFRQYASGKISEPGAYIGVPMSVYHGDPCVGPSISSSGLRTIFIDSPKHYWNGSPYNPDREEIEQTEAIILGRAAHHLFLGEPDFQQHFVLQPAVYVPDRGKDAGFEKPWSNNAEVCKKWNGEQALAGRTVLTTKQIENVKGMAASLAAEPIVQGGILNGYVEVSFFWQDAETGIWLKARPDVVPNESGDVADMKCVADVSDDGISRGLGDRGYHQQGALVGEAFRQVWQMEMEHFTLVYVESKKPHCVRFDEIAPEEIAQGFDENHAALRLMKRCLDTGYWPGPKSMQGDGGYVRRPSYAAHRAARRLETINLELNS